MKMTDCGWVTNANYWFRPGCAAAQLEASRALWDSPGVCWSPARSLQLLWDPPKTKKDSCMNLSFGNLLGAMIPDILAFSQKNPCIHLLFGSLFEAMILDILASSKKIHAWNFYSEVFGWNYNSRHTSFQQKDSCMNLLFESLLGVLRPKTKTKTKTKVTMAPSMLVKSGAV